MELLIRETGKQQHSRLSAGVHYDSSTEKYQIGVTARKNIQLGSSETWLKLSQDALYDPKTQKVMVIHCFFCCRRVCNAQRSLRSEGMHAKYAITVENTCYCYSTLSAQC